jgi:hypothetical protein
MTSAAGRTARRRAHNQGYQAGLAHAAEEEEGRRAGAAHAAEDDAWTHVTGGAAAGEWQSASGGGSGGGGGGGEKGGDGEGELALVAAAGLAAVVGALAAVGVQAVNKRREARALARACAESSAAAAKLPPRLVDVITVALPRAVAVATLPPPPPPPPPHPYDCFMSYRRSDFRVADAVEAQLQLSGLRVFKARRAHRLPAPAGGLQLRRTAPVCLPRTHGAARRARSFPRTVCHARARGRSHASVAARVQTLAR